MFQKAIQFMTPYQRLQNGFKVSAMVIENAAIPG
jgi:hypothetical protein